jgi:hypothetical protein
MYKVEYSRVDLMLSDWIIWPQIGEFDTIQDALVSIETVLLKNTQSFRQNSKCCYFEYDSKNEVYLWTNGKETKYQFRFPKTYSPWDIGLNDV